MDALWPIVAVVSSIAAFLGGYVLGKRRAIPAARFALRAEFGRILAGEKTATADDMRAAYDKGRAEGLKAAYTLITKARKQRGGR